METWGDWEDEDEVVTPAKPVKPVTSTKAAPKPKRPQKKAAPAKSDMNTKLTIRFSDQQLQSIKDQLARSATLSTELRLIILDHFGISE